VPIEMSSHYSWLPQCGYFLGVLYVVSLPLAAQCEPGSPRFQTTEITEDWPRWRGARFDGVTQETNWSHDWDNDGPPKAWEQPIGIGFSSVAIQDGRLYTMGSIAREAGKDAGEEATRTRDDVIWCINSLSGEVIWTHEYPAELVDVLHEGGPSATPTLDKDRGYTISKQGLFLCFDIETGSIHWQHQLTELLDVEMPMWGFAGSALVVGNLVIVEAGRTVAFDRLTGEIEWQTEVFKPAYSSPVQFEHPLTGEALVASLNNEVLLVLEAQTGAEIARRAFTTSHPTNACTPIVHKDTIFLSSGYNRGCTLLRLSNGNLERVYDNRNMRNHMNSCVLHGGYLYGIDGNSHSRRSATIRCIDWDAGELRWKERGYGVGSLLLAGDRFIALSDEGELLVFEPNPDAFMLLARAQVLDGKCWTPPVLCNGLLYLRNADGRLICLDLRGSQSTPRE
jgi:outer membrane protein assembly factor BamB